jgi:hypothetical protein
MGKLFQKCAVAAVGAGFSLIAIAAKPVQAATMVWGLKFFQAGTQVGSGEFSYNPDKTTFIQTSMLGSSLPPSGFYVRTALDSFSADILGEQWRPAIFLTWWADGSRPPGQQVFARGTVRPGINQGVWFFGDPFLGTRQLLLDNMQPISDDVWTGNWLGLVARPSVPGGVPMYGFGVWTATRQNPQPVPEPTFPLGLLVFGVLGAALKHKQQESIEK